MKTHNKNGTCIEAKGEHEEQKRKDNKHCRPVDHNFSLYDRRTAASTATAAISSMFGAAEEAALKPRFWQYVP